MSLNKSLTKKIRSPKQAVRQDRTPYTPLSFSPKAGLKKDRNVFNTLKQKLKNIRTGRFNRKDRNT